MLDRLPLPLLRLEGAALAVAALVLYVEGGHSWPLFALLILAPDLGMLGYLAGDRIGAAAYDLVHITVWPLALGVAGVLGDSGTAIAIALVWLTHIGVDRALGYGLKYGTGFRDTHLQRV